MSKALIIVTEENWREVPSYIYVREIPYLDRRLTNLVAQLYDRNLLERQPLSVIRQEEKVDGKNYDIYKVLAKLIGENRPDLKDFAKSLYDLHNISIQLRYHPKDNTKKTWGKSVHAAMYGRQNNTLNYEVLRTEANKEAFDQGAQHQAVSDGFKIRNRLIFAFMSLLKIIIDGNSNSKQTETTEGIQKTERRPEAVEAGN